MPKRLASFSWLRVRSILILCYKRSHRFEEKPAPPVLMANAAYQKTDVTPCGRQVDRPRMRQGLLICYKREADERSLGAIVNAPSGVLSIYHSGSNLLRCGARGRSRTGTAKAEGFSYHRQLSLLSLLKRHLWSGLSLYPIAQKTSRLR